MGRRVVSVRAAAHADVEGVARMSAELWPDATIAEHAAHASEILDGRAPSTLPLAILVAERDGELAGFIEVGLRSHADGCDTRWAVGFVEGWFVASGHRRSGVGRALVDAAEAWSRSHGAREIASDTWIDHDDSIAAHEALGFEIVDRCVHFRKSL